jgi:hypothetical protein
MAFKNYYFTGIAKWAKVREGQQDQYKDGNPQWSIQLYPDDASMKTFNKSGLQLKVKDDADGQYVNFRKTAERYSQKDKELKKYSPPEVFLRDPETGNYNKWPSGLIGNGSKVTLTVSVYDGENGKGHLLERVFIDELVVYDPDASRVTPDTTANPF